MALTTPDRAASPLAICLFGPFEAHLHGSPLPQLRSRKEGLLLALLALRHGDRVERPWLAGVLWPDSAERQAFAYLRNTLTDLRRALGPEAHRLCSPTSRTLCLDLAGADVDVVRFDAAVAQGDPASLETAVSLYRGALLEGCTEEWVFQEREAREQAYLGALERLAEHALARGDHPSAERQLRLAVAAEPLRESAQRTLMKVLAAGGNYAGAMQAYRDLRERLHHEINAEPDPDTQALFQQLREEARAKAAEGTGLRAPSGPSAMRRRKSGTVPGLDAGVVTHRRPKRSLLVFSALGVMLLAFVLTALTYFGQFQEQRNSIAVLPFANATADPENEYLSDGITEDLITALAQVRGLRVPARTSAFKFKGTSEDIRKIGKQLNVGVLLEGSVRASGNKLHINARLISAAEGYTLWAQTYERDKADLFAIQDEISRRIIDTLKVRLTDEHEIRTARGHPRNAEAYHLYLRGRYFWNKRTEADLKKAISYFQQAINAEQDYALAYSGLADAYNMLAYSCYLAPVDAFPKAKRAAARALELDSELAEPHASLGYARMYFDWDFAEARRDFQRAIQRDPNSVNAHQWYSVLLTAMGRPKEAHDEIALAQQFDPLSVPITTDMGFELHYNRQNEQAIRQLQSALEINPNFPLAHFWLGRVYATQGLYDQALAEFEAGGPALREWQPMTAARGYIYGVWGKRAEADRVLRDFTGQAKRGQFVTSYGIALVHAGLNEREQAFAWLEKAYEERSHWLVWLRLDPRWDRLRSDPRFVTLLQKVGFGS